MGWGLISLVTVLVQCVQSPEFNAYQLTVAWRFQVRLQWEGGRWGTLQYSKRKQEVTFGV